MLSCVKHFALYGASEAGKDYNTVDMSHLRMYNEYFAPYRAAVEAGVGSVMSSFNIVDGIPATANKWLLTDVLRDEWGFQGLLVTDYNSIAEMSIHGVAPLKEASVRALQAGTDMDMVSCGFLNTLEESLKEGKSPKHRLMQLAVVCWRLSINWACLPIHINIAIRYVRKKNFIHLSTVQLHARLRQRRLFY
nr:glycoside hydrolase family 3 N-terminal domain-containing protein [Bacteroides thetaiotaomicron]